MEDVARSFIDYFNDEFDRDFSLNDWEDKIIINYDEKLFTKNQLSDIYDTFYEFAYENRYAEEPYYIVVDMENHECIDICNTPDSSNAKYEYLFVELSEDPDNFFYNNNCKEIIEKHFNITFGLDKVYGFDIYE